jgi:hypothetical protein
MTPKITYDFFGDTICFTCIGSSSLLVMFFESSSIDYFGYLCFVDYNSVVGESTVTTIVLVEMGLQTRIKNTGDQE